MDKKMDKKMDEKMSVSAGGDGGIIRQLDPLTASRIAAGEVVERPYSVVKELVENAIDAGAGHITVRLAANKADGDSGEESGKYINTIQVIDDGCGMLPVDMHQAFGRHATSKLGSADELSIVRTLGFRGEALPSIAAVSRVEMQSCAAGAECGFRVEAAEGEVKDAGVAVLSGGTVITVRGLFYNTPARKKFLKSYATETGLVSRLIGELILSRPDIAFSLQIDGRQVLRSPGGGSIEKAILSVYGAQVMAALRPVSYRQGGVGISGYVSMPPFARSSRRYYHFFVNGRLVRSKELAAIIDTAYHSLMPEGRHPLVALYFDLPTMDVDVNVHPAKTEIRFKKLSEVREAMLPAVRQALSPRQSVQPIQSGQSVQFGQSGQSAKSVQSRQSSVWELLGKMGAKPVAAGESADEPENRPAENAGENIKEKNIKENIKDRGIRYDDVVSDVVTGVMPGGVSDVMPGGFAGRVRAAEDGVPVLDFAEEMSGRFAGKSFGSYAGNYAGNNKALDNIMVTGDDMGKTTDDNMADNNMTDNNIDDKKTENGEQEIKPEINIKEIDLKSLSTPQEVTSLLTGQGNSTPDFASKLFENLLANAPGERVEYRRDDGDWLAENFGITYMEDYNKTESEQTQLFGGETNLFLALHPIGQLNNSYIIATLGEDLYVIDQHAAHERILYEEFSLAFMIDNRETSLLAVPVSVDVGDLHAELLLNNITRLADFGFVLEHFGGSTFVLRGVPLWFVRGSESMNQRKSEIYQTDCRGFFLDVFDMMLETAEDEVLDIARLNRLELFTKACKSAIKANQRLNGQEISWLLHNLAECEKPQTCPHGRPTCFKMTDAEIRHRFMRS